ncbi:MAG: hypothetical protein MJZ21_01105 [archaeon]|nr:hypothetical protein [archaeon]
MEAWIKQFTIGVIGATILMAITLPLFSPSFGVPQYDLDIRHEYPDSSDYIDIVDLETDSEISATLFLKSSDKIANINVVGHYSINKGKSAEVRIYLKSETMLLPVKIEKAAFSVNPITSESTDFCNYISILGDTSETSGECTTGAFSLDCKYFRQMPTDTFAIMFAVGNDYGLDGLPGSTCTKTICTYSLKWIDAPVPN